MMNITILRAEKLDKKIASNVGKFVLKSKFKIHV